MYDVARLDPPADSAAATLADGCGGDAHSSYYATEWELPDETAEKAGGAPTVDMLAHGFVTNVPSYLRGREQDDARDGPVPEYTVGREVGDYRVVRRDAREVVFQRAASAGDGEWFVVLRLAPSGEPAGDGVTVYEAGVGLVVRHESELGAVERHWKMPMTESVNRFMMKQGVLYCRERVGHAVETGFDLMTSFVNQPPPPQPSPEAVAASGAARI
jgi:hypothetical protein